MKLFRLPRHIQGLLYAPLLIAELAHSGAFHHTPARRILNLLISKTAVSTSWPAWCAKVHIKLVQLAKSSMATLSAAFDSTQHTNWRDLYLSALFELDPTKTAARIVEAEKALIVREHELFSTPLDQVERDAVNTALHSLHALRNCLSINSTRFAA